jgi:surfeit locus 1 family protein
MLVLEFPAGGPGLIASPLPAGLSNRHLEYAITWYGLALALASVYIAKLLRDRKA